MFQMMALVCGLTMQEGMTEEGCFTYKSIENFDTKEECETVLETTALIGLSVHLMRLNEVDASIESLECGNIGTPAKG